MKQPSPIRKIWSLLTQRERRRAVLVLVLMIVGMALEMLGISLVVPVIAVLTDPSLAGTGKLGRLLGGVGAGARNRDTVVVWGMLILVGMYLFKTLFLIGLAWYQTRFVFQVQSNLSQRLFTLYL